MKVDLLLLGFSGSTGVFYVSCVFVFPTVLITLYCVSLLPDVRGNSVYFLSHLRNAVLRCEIYTI